MRRLHWFTAMLLLAWAVPTLTGAALRNAQDFPPQSDFPDPLKMLDGTVIKTRADWFSRRVPELKALFQDYMYGPIPPAPDKASVLRQNRFDGFLDGKATLKVVTLGTGPANAPRIDLLLVVPKKRSAPGPVFLTMNFCGNHALTADPRVPLARGWVYDSCGGSSNHSATDAGRGSQAADWPLADIVRRGYALASFHSADVDADRKEVSDGLYAWLAGSDAPRNNPTNRGSIAAWAWGFHRCVDYLVTDSDIDPKRIAALGHSRNGKTALLAAAFDERIAMAFPHQAGCGGSAPSRGKVGESVKAINDRFPHWFNAAFKQFNNTPERLPFDQHCLVALCAPRPVLFSAAEEDQWANPAGQFQILRGADPVYGLLGLQGIGATQIPPAGQLVDSPLGYYIRAGKHSMTPGDWTVFMDFADRHFKVPAKDTRP